MTFWVFQRSPAISFSEKTIKKHAPLCRDIGILTLSCVSFRYILLLLVLFAIPGLVMIVAYGLISRELYRGIQFEMGHKKDSTGEAMYTTCGEHKGMGREGM